MNAWAVWCNTVQDIVDRANRPGIALLTTVSDGRGGLFVFVKGNIHAERAFMEDGEAARPRWTIVREGGGDPR